MPNRLANSASPYLLQHAENPVDWFEWSAEAFEKAEREQKPIFLSIGYSSCHWCHVMAHESFEDAEIGEILNQGFVAIKVDREELPHIDETYMTAVQLSNGQGGWPMSVFLTPSKEPFFAGTYFPKEDRAERIGFKTLCTRINEIWQNERASLTQSAREFSNALERALTSEVLPMENALTLPFLEQQIEEILSTYDAQNGGFGGAPKFPPHSALRLLFEFGLGEIGDDDLRRRCLHAATHTMEAMCLGGIYDHVGGGFHRYSTDPTWHLPHFEKMLYDNGLMLINLSLAIKASPSKSDYFRSVLERTIGWLKREMLTEDGLFGSALDADSEGEEGKFYTWRIEELKQVLGERYAELASVFPLFSDGNFLDEATRQKTGENLLHATVIPSPIVQDLFDPLYMARIEREKPLFDTKAVVCWNGLVIDGFYANGLEEMAIEFTSKLASYFTNGALPRVIHHGKAAGEATLEDIAAMLLILEQNDPLAKKLWRDVERFKLPSGVFASTRSDQALFGQIVPAFDQPIPSGNALLVQAMICHGRHEEAWQLLSALSGWMQRAPHATEALHFCLFLLLQKGFQPVRIDWNSSLVTLHRPGYKVQSIKIGKDTIENPTETQFVIEGDEVNIEVLFCNETQCLAPEKYAFFRPTELLEHS